MNLAVLRSDILILEDDATLSGALKEAFTRAGFNVYVPANAADAESMLSSKPIGTMFIDCLLPDTSGVEFATEIRKKYPPALLDIVLMSGILTDPAFIKESIRDTKAKHFLKKPFDLSDATSLVNKPSQTASVSSSNTSPRKAMYEIYRRGRVGPQVRKEVIESLDEVYGYDLPFILNLIIDSRESGDLSVSRGDTLLSKISFSHGNITNVVSSEKDAPLGKLLVDSGFVHAEDLAIAEKDTSNKKFGEKLISNFLASPHGLDLVLTQQLNIRLSKLITEKSLKLKFEEKENDESATQIDAETFTRYLHDWVASKIPLTWLKAHLLQWGGAKILKTEYYKNDHPAFKMPLVLALPGIVETYAFGVTLQEVIDAKLFAEEPVVKSFMVLFSKGLLTFEESKQSMSAEDQIKVLAQLNQQFAGVNQSQVYDWMVLVVSGDPTKPDAILSSIKKLMGPQPDGSDQKLLTLFETLTHIVEKAADFVKSGKREKMKADLAKSEAEAVLRVSKVIDAAKEMLFKNTYKPAFDSLKSIQSQAQGSGISKFRIYYAWAQIGSLDLAKNREAAINSTEMDLLQVPPEEKSDALFSYVSGLVAKAKGDKSQAKKFFEKSLALDPDLIIAKRELSLLTQQSAAKAGAVSDSKGLFGLFKK